MRLKKDIEAIQQELGLILEANNISNEKAEGLVKLRLNDLSDV